MMTIKSQLSFWIIYTNLFLKRENTHFFQYYNPNLFIKLSAIYLETETFFHKARRVITFDMDAYGIKPVTQVDGESFLILYSNIFLVNYGTCRWQIIY